MSDAEPPNVYSETKPTARKNHKCCQCYGWIKSGEVYHLCKGVWPAGPMTFKVCVDCKQLMDDINAGLEPWNHWEQVPFEGLSDWCHESDEPSDLARFKAIKEKRRMVG